MDYTNLLRKHHEKMTKSLEEIQEHEAKKAVQPFRTNKLLEELSDSQTPKWVNYTILFFALLTLLIAIISLLHNYKII